MLFKNYFFGLTKQEREIFAKSVNSTVGHLNNFAYGYTPLADKVCVLIEQVSKRSVTRQELRPNDWVEVWPELKRKNQNVKVSG